MKLPDFLVDHCDGEIRLTGHRIGIYTVVRDYIEGNTAEQIAEEYDTLALELVYRVIAFYLANRSEVDQYVGACRAELDRQVAANVPGPGQLRIRGLMQVLEQADAQNQDDPAWSSLSVGERIDRLGLLNHREA